MTKKGLFLHRLTYVLPLAMQKAHSSHLAAENNETSLYRLPDGTHSTDMKDETGTNYRGVT